MSKTFTMTFMDSNRKERKITLPDGFVGDGVQDSEVAKAMDDIIKSEVLLTKEGKITAKKNAYITQTRKTALDIENGH